MPRTATEEAQCNESCALGHSSSTWRASSCGTRRGDPPPAEELRRAAVPGGASGAAHHQGRAARGRLARRRRQRVGPCGVPERAAQGAGRSGAESAVHRDGAPAGVSLHRRDRQTGAGAERAARRRGFRAADAADRGPTDGTGPAARLVGQSAARRATDRLRDRGARHRQVDGGRRLRRPGLRRRRDVERAGPVHRTLRRRRALSLRPGRTGAAVPGRARRARHGGLAPLRTDLAGADALGSRRRRAGRPRAPRAGLHSRPHVARAGGGRGGVESGAPVAPVARGSALE